MPRLGKGAAKLTMRETYRPGSSAASAWRDGPSRYDDRVSTDEIAAQLEVRRDELAGELARLTAPPEAGVGVGFGKRVGDGTTEAVERFATTAQARSIAASLAAVDRVLAKIAEGTYGRCDECGAEIPALRLEAMPATAHCFACRAALEG